MYIFIGIRYNAHGGYPMIKLMAFDMDGTLLNSQHEIDVQLKQRLIALEKQGIRLVLASGRGYRKLIPYAKELAMDSYGGYLIEFNGLAVNDLTHMKRTVEKQIDISEMQDLYAFTKSFELEMQFMHDDGMYIYIPEARYEEKKSYRLEHHIPEDFPWTRGDFEYMHDNRIGYPNQVYIKTADEINHHANKIGIASEEQNLDAYIKAFQKKYDDKFWIGKTAPTWLEITPLHINKANALKKVVDDLDISMDEVMAFGDGENDIEMLKSVKYGIAMGNALDSVKKISYAVTGNHNEGGILEAIEKYVGQNNT